MSSASIKGGGQMSDSKERFVDVALPTSVRSLFTYALAEGMSVAPGQRVWVPLRNEFAMAMVIRVHHRKPDFEVRTVGQVLDPTPLLSEPMLALADWVHRFYYCSMGEAVQAMLPSGLNFISEKWLRQAKALPSTLRGVDMALAREVLEEFDGPVGSDRVASENMQEDAKTRGMKLAAARRRWKGLEQGKVLETLIRRGILQVWEQPRQRKGRRKAVEQQPKGGGALLAEGVEGTGKSTPKPLPLKELTDEQKACSEAILNAAAAGRFQSFLLHGVTGSGKTEVYMHALAQVLAQGRGAIVLVPEIALTPQTVRRFTDVFGDQVAVLHSRLTDRERIDAWQDLSDGRRTIAIGPRSAIFAPVRDPGLIVVDEEHDSSYKQIDPAPRYHARDVALVRASRENAVVILGSATPSLSTVEAARRGKHTLLTLLTRPFGAMPEVTILPMKQYRTSMRGPLTAPLWLAMEKALAAGEQSILLFNRRGFASYLQCEECGHIPQSPDCAVSLTYHHRRDILLCHYTGYSRRADRTCEACGSPQMAPRGMGTQQVEEEVAALFPKARLLRMDRDSTGGRQDHETIYTKVLSGQVDILIGTQMLAKGLDFPNVTVVGVLQAENELAFPSWRSSERLYQLLSQVSGRAGRAERPGQVFIQTWKPDHPSMEAVRLHSYPLFEAAERDQRKVGAYPPFSRMVMFHFKGRDEQTTIRVAEAFTGVVRAQTSEASVLGPSPAVIPWMQGMHHWQSALKIAPGVTATQISTVLDGIFAAYEGEGHRRSVPGASAVRVNVDVDAIE